MRMIRFFQQNGLNRIDLSDKAIVDLEELSFGGFRVPQGFCVTDHSFWYNFTPESNVRQLLRQLPKLHGTILKEAVNELRILILTSKLDEEFLQSIYMALLLFGLRERYSVSLLHTYGLPKIFPFLLNKSYYYVTGPEEIAQKIRECWATWWTEEAILFRRLYNISYDDLSVVIQLCPPAESSGLLFTGLYGSRLGRTNILANYGFFNLERGAYDYYSLRGNSEVIEKKIGLHHGMFPHYDFKQERQKKRTIRISCLNDIQLFKLASLGMTVEDIYGEPQCIIWSMYKGEYYLLRIFPVKYLFQRHETFEDNFKQNGSNNEGKITKKRVDFFSWVRKWKE